MLITTITMRSAMSITTAMMRSAMSIITTITMRNAMGIITMMAAVMSIHHHHADEVFTSWGMETIVPVTHEQLEDVLKRLSNTREFGDVLRAKGMLPTENPGEWLYFDLVPEQYEIRQGRPDYTGKVCVIGASLKEEELNSVFGRG